MKVPGLSIWLRNCLRNLPQVCVLCGAPALNQAVCGDCDRDLPRLGQEVCPICADLAPASVVCGACLRSQPNFDASFAAMRYQFPADTLIHALKYQHRLSLVDWCANEMLREPPPAGDLLIPLPLSPARLRERGFNQALEIARLLAKKQGLLLSSDAVLRVRHTSPQANLPWKQRRSNIRGAFACQRDVSGKTVIVVDDVMTTGATLNECARILKEAGAQRVINWVLARTIKN